MPTLFLRTLIVYSIMFAILRLMGKRQINEMQPFDLAITLLIANLASIPMSDAATPLLYGIIPMIALFIVQRLVSFFSLKSEKVRKLVCGSPLIVISNGVVRENVLRAANYSLTDLMEQLRLKDVFSISNVEYAILETNGSLSVLLKGPYQTPTNESLELASESAKPQLILVLDGKLHKDAMSTAGITLNELERILKKTGAGSYDECLFVLLDGNGMMHIQNRKKNKKLIEPIFYDNSKKAKGANK